MSCSYCDTIFIVKYISIGNRQLIVYNFFYSNNWISMNGSGATMGKLTKLIVLLIAFRLTLGFTFHRQSESYETGSSINYENAQSAGSSNLPATSDSGCCILNSWAYKNYDDVREFASRLRQEYNSMSSGSTSGSSINYRPWAGKWSPIFTKRSAFPSTS